MGLTNQCARSQSISARACSTRLAASSSPAVTSPGNRLVLVADRKPEPGPRRPLDKRLSIPMVRCVVQKIDRAVPVDHNAVDARELDQKGVVLDDVRIARVIGADQRMVVRRDRRRPLFFRRSGSNAPIVQCQPHARLWGMAMYQGM